MVTNSSILLNSSGHSSENTNLKIVGFVTVCKLIPNIDYSAEVRRSVFNIMKPFPPPFLLTRIPKFNLHFNDQKRLPENLIKNKV